MNTTGWLTRLIAFDTTSRNSNLELIADIEAWFSKHKITTRRSYDPTGQKANLVATIPAHNGNSQGGILLSGHTDVVPVDGQTWETPPFTATVKDQKIYGRGACDMKGFLAVMLALVPTFKQLSLTKPLHLAFSYDEEVGCLGARTLITDLAKQGIKPDACIVGEPTEMRLVIAHKGIHGFHCSVQGKAVHSSLVTKGCNAIDYAARLIGELHKLATELREDGPQDQHYDVPYTTLSTNLIQGGNALNTVPAQCKFSFEFRNLPETDPVQIQKSIQKTIQDLLPIMQREFPGASIELEPMNAVPGLETPENTPITQLIRRLTHDQGIHKVSYATEAGLFHLAGIPTIIFGPGSIEQAHRANEFIALDQLERCETFLKALAITPQI